MRCRRSRCCRPVPSPPSAPQGRGGPRPPPLFAGNPPELHLPRSPVRSSSLIVAVGRRFRSPRPSPPLLYPSQIEAEPVCPFPSDARCRSSVASSYRGAPPLPFFAVVPLGEHSPLSPSSSPSSAASRACSRRVATAGGHPTGSPPSRSVPLPAMPGSRLPPPLAAPRLRSLVCAAVARVRRRRPSQPVAAPPRAVARPGRPEPCPCRRRGRHHRARRRHRARPLLRRRHARRRARHQVRSRRAGGDGRRRA